MFESGLRFAFAFLPAGVAVVVGLVLAVQRRRVHPQVATPAIWGLALQLLAILVSASTNLIPSLVLAAGVGLDTALTISVVIGIATALLTVISWVLILTALFTRLPARAAAPAVAAPVPAAPVVGPEPFADDAPTGRHALLDEHGQQVVAQEGVRLSPRAAALAAGGAAVGVAGAAAASSRPFPADGPRLEELPTEAVPVVRPEPEGPGDDHSASEVEEVVDGTPDDTPDDTESATAPDEGPAGVDEAAVGGMPVEPAGDDESSATIATPGSPTSADDHDASGTTRADEAEESNDDGTHAPDPSPISIDEGALGGVPTVSRDATPDEGTTPDDDAPPDGGPDQGTPQANTSDEDGPAGHTPKVGATPASHPGLAPMMTPRPATPPHPTTASPTTASPTTASPTRRPSPGGSDLFSPVPRSDEPAPSVAGWFEPVTDSPPGGFGRPGEEPRNGQTPEH